MEKIKGITLISLVITIIILLILAGVSLSLVVGEDGIVKRAIDAGEQSQKATAKEKVQIEVLSGYNSDGVFSATNVKNNILSHIDNSQVNGEEFSLIAIVDGYKFLIDEFGNVNIIDDIYEYKCTSDVQTFVVPQNGSYKIELWGASGGDMNGYLGGAGGYTSGYINLTKDEKIYVYVGGHRNSTTGGYNGGANGGTKNDGTYTGGGGATDIRLTNGDWNDFESLKSRIMVSAGGGGTGIYVGNIIKGGAGGGLSGYQGELSSCGGNHIIATAGKQNTYGLSINNGSFPKWNGGFGFASGYSSDDASDPYGTGGGSGYYGGGSGRSTLQAVSSGAGGSSFISGYEGCDAIDESSTADNIIHTGQPIHYSGYKFTNPVMIDGNTSMVSPSGEKEIGHSGNGYARIMLIEN